MPATLITCPGCKAALPAAVFNLPDLTPCPVCGQPIQIDVFPAFFRPVTAGQMGEAMIEDGQAGCFYHPQKKAVLPCDACGRFLCALCDCELDGRHICPACLETGRNKGKIQSLQNHRILYDSIALALAIAPAATLLGACFVIVTSPAAIFVAIRHWNTPGSIVRRTKIRFVLAIIFASLSLIGWFAYAFLLFYASNHVKRR